jgi:hypothetical protein
MKNKLTFQELKDYILNEAKKLYKLEVLKEEKTTIEQTLVEWDKKAMLAAKQDIENSGQKFEPLGKNKFEKHLNKKELNKAMSPETHKGLEENSPEPIADDIGNKLSVQQMYYFKIKHDNGVLKIKTASTSEESARKAIANAEGAPESAIQFIKSTPL